MQRVVKSVGKRLTQVCLQQNVINRPTSTLNDGSNLQILKTENTFWNRSPQELDFLAAYIYRPDFKHCINLP